jgi:formylglycine-generating enzyme
MRRSPAINPLLPWLLAGLFAASCAACKRGEVDGQAASAAPGASAMIRIEAGTFAMGSPSGEHGRRGDEAQHEVTLSRPFLLAATEVTQARWQHVMETNPSTRSGLRLPVENISWPEAARFCNRLSNAEGLTRAYTIDGDAVTWNPGTDGYRLPTEAEWEYACRAGSTTAYSGEDCLSSAVANCDTTMPPPECPAGTSVGRTMEVMSLRANAWGLYDMHGNVREWCWDAMAPYSTDPVTDPAVHTTDDPYPRRVERGGSWHTFATDARCAARNASPPGMTHDSVGLRLARSIPE